MLQAVGYGEELELPSRVALRHGEVEGEGAVVVRYQDRIEEGRFREVFTDDRLGILKGLNLFLGDYRLDGSFRDRSHILDRSKDLRCGRCRFHLHAARGKNTVACRIAPDDETARKHLIPAFIETVESVLRNRLHRNARVPVAGVVTEAFPVAEEIGGRADSHARVKDPTIGVKLIEGEVVHAGQDLGTDGERVGVGQAELPMLLLTGHELVAESFGVEGQAAVRLAAIHRDDFLVKHTLFDKRQLDVRPQPIFLAERHGELAVLVAEREALEVAPLARGVDQLVEDVSHRVARPENKLGRFARTEFYIVIDHPRMRFHGRSLVVLSIYNNVLPIGAFLPLRILGVAGKPVFPRLERGKDRAAQRIFGRPYAGIHDGKRFVVLVQLAEAERSVALQLDLIAGEDAERGRGRVFLHLRMDVERKEETTVADCEVIVALLRFAPRVRQEDIQAVVESCKIRIIDKKRVCLRYKRNGESTVGTDCSRPFSHLLVIEVVAQATPRVVCPGRHPGYRPG